MFRTNDPERDFDRYEAEQERELNKRPDKQKDYMQAL